MLFPPTEPYEWPMKIIVLKFLHGYLSKQGLITFVMQFIISEIIV